MVTMLFGVEVWAGWLKRGGSEQGELSSGCGRSEVGWGLSRFERSG